MNIENRMETNIIKINRKQWSARNKKPIGTQLCALLLAAHVTGYTYTLNFKLYATQLKQLSQTQTHPLRNLNAHFRSIQKHESHNLS